MMDVRNNNQDNNNSNNFENDDNHDMGRLLETTTTTNHYRHHRNNNNNNNNNSNNKRIQEEERCHDNDAEEELLPLQQEQQIQEQQQQQQQPLFLHVAASDNTSSPTFFNVSSTSTNEDINNNNHSQNNNNNKFLFPLLLGNRILFSYNIFLSKFYWLVLLLIVILLWPFGFYALKDLTSNTDSTFKHGISNSLSQKAENAFDKKFYNNHHDNDKWDNHPLILVVLSLLDEEEGEEESQNSNSTTTTKSSLIHNEYVQNTSLMLQSYLENLFIDNNNNTNKTSADKINIEVSSYYSYKNRNLTLLGRPYMSHDGKTTILEIEYKTNPTKIHVQKSMIVSKIANALTDFYSNNTSSYHNNNSSNNIQVGFTGLDYFSHDLRLATQNDLKRMDILVLPISLLLLGCTINPYRLWLIWILPLFAIISTIATWSIITYHIIMVKCKIQITQFTPSIMMSLTLGMGMDYALFLLSRYSEAYKTRRIEKAGIQTTTTTISTNDANNNNNNGGENSSNNITKDKIKFHAIQEMLQHTSKVILVSGITLLCTFLALIALPLKMIQSVGWGCATCIASAIILNLVTIPALLYTKLGDWIISTSNLEGQQQEEESDEEEEEGREHHLPLLTSLEEQMTSDNDDGTSNQQLLRQQPLLLENDGNIFPSPPPPLESTSSPSANISSSVAGAGEVDVVLPVDQQSFWIRLSKHYLLHPYKSIIVMLLLWQFLFWPVGKNAFRLKSTSIAFESLLPTQSQSMQTYRRLMTGMDKGPGRMAPFRILVDFSNSSLRLDSPDGFDILHRLVREMTTTTTVSDTASDAKTLSTPSEKYQNDTSFSELMPLWRTSMNFNSISSTDDSTDKYVHNNDKTLRPLPKATFTGISVMDNIPIPYAIYVASKICGGGGGGGGGGGHNNKNSSSWCPIEAMRALNVLDGMVTSHDRMATYLTVNIQISPFSDDGVYWLDEMRKRIANFNQNHTTVGGAVNSRGGVDIYIDGSAAIAHDAVQAVYQAFPWVVGITLGVVFGLLGLYFGSIVPPLRSVVSISCTLAVAFGSAVLVYQDEMFSHTQQVMATVPELCWLVPVMSFSIIVGLALDYDVFLVSRIYEFRSLDGYRHESSIVAGLNATGGIITAAGIIMATAFGSLLWSASPALEQWAFMVTTAVLLDTFVTRTAVVPILLGWTGTYSWYPHKFESSDGSTRRLEGFDEDHDDSIARALDTNHTRSEQGNRGEQEEESEIL